MKKIKSFIVLTLILALSMTTLAFAAEEKKAPFEYETETLTQAIDQVAVVLLSMNDKDITYVEEHENQYPGYFTNGVSSFKGIKGQLDEISADTQIVFTDKKVENFDDYVEATGVTTVGDKKVKVTIKFVEFMGSATPENISFTIVDEEKTSMGQRMTTALMNTVTGLGIVFVVLFLIMCIISLFQFIPKIQAKLAAKGEEKKKVEVAVNNTVAQIEKKEEATNLVNDMELVAAIAAAVAAYEGTSTDGFVVRSIRARY